MTRDPGFGRFEGVFTRAELEPAIGFARRRVLHVEYAGVTSFGPGLDLRIG